MNIHCPVCRTDIPADDYKKTHISAFNNEECKLYHCPQCDLQFWHPLRIVAGFYEDETDVACFGLHAGMRKDLSFNQQSFFRHFPLRSGKLLDIGCGDGMFLGEAQKAGFEVYGMDPNPTRVKTAKERFGVDHVYTMTLAEFVPFAKKEGLVFDVVTFFDVLEHQDDPRGFAEMARSLLRPGGWVAGGVPHRDRLWASRERENPEVGDFPPHHLLWWSKRSLTNLFSAQGFSLANYPTAVTVSHLAAYLDSLIFGRFGRRLKASAKKALLGDDKKDLSLKDEGVGRSMALGTLRFLRTLRNLAFLPIALLLIWPYNRRGAMMYFQGSLDR